MEIPVDCIGFAKSAVIMSDIILYMLRQEFRTEGIRNIIHLRLYKGVEPNGKCPCGSTRNAVGMKLNPYQESDFCRFHGDHHKRINC